MTWTVWHLYPNLGFEEASADYADEVIDAWRRSESNYAVVIDEPGFVVLSRNRHGGASDTRAIVIFCKRND